MRFLSAETAVGESDVDPTVGLEVESLILLLVCVTTVIVVFLLLKDLDCWFPRASYVVGKDRSTFVKSCQERPPKTFTTH